MPVARLSCLKAALFISDFIIIIIIIIIVYVTVISSSHDVPLFHRIRQIYVHAFHLIRTTCPSCRPGLTTMLVPASSAAEAEK